MKGRQSFVVYWVRLMGQLRSHIPNTKLPKANCSSHPNQGRQLRNGTSALFRSV